MCGIAGIIARGRDPVGLREAIQRMTDALSHRGPDDAGIECLSLPDGTELCLGHRRLSILDLTANGHQPMGHAATGSWVVFNGEIYNHLELRGQLPGEFRSTCDTETLLRGWIEKGPEWVRSLTGIFAFALLDGRRQELWLARDHLGVKPLYISQPDDDLWLFASEVRALLASGMVNRRLSSEGLNSYLAFGAVQAPWTMVAGVRSLMPGEQWCFPLRGNSGGLLPRVSRYWSPAEYFPQHPAGSGDRPRSGNSSLHEDDFGQLKAIWDKAIGSQMISDVPVGVFLSGGTDSSAIVGTLARQGHVPRTFSVAFSEQAFDESQHARQIAKKYGTEHKEIAVTPQQVLDSYAPMMAAYDQPSIDGINTYVISKAVREMGIKVALSGLGGDELFAGYPTFHRLPLLSKWARFVPKRMARLGISLFTRATGSGRGLRLGTILSDETSRLNIYYGLRQLFALDSRDGLIAGGAPNGRGVEPKVMALLSRQAEATDDVNAVSLLELSLYMQNMLLRDTDQMSMAHGLEVRVPLLDQRLVEAVAGIRGSMKISRGDAPNKWLLIKLADLTLPSEAIRRPKMGFVFPWDDWLRRELRSQTEEILMDQSAVASAGLRGLAVASLWRQYLEGKITWRSSDILALVHLVAWTRMHNLAPPVPSIQPRFRMEEPVGQADRPTAIAVKRIRRAGRRPGPPFGRRRALARIMLLMPEIAASRGGGIYQVGCSLMRLLSKERQENGIECQVLSLGQPDRDADSQKYVQEWDKRMTCFGTHRLAFVRAAVASLASWADVMVSTHVGLTSLVNFVPRMLRPTTLTFVHGIEVWRPLNWRHRSALRNSDYVAANSRFTAHKASEYNPWLGGIHCCHLGIALGEVAEPASNEELLRLAPTRHDILIASRMAKGQCEKGHRALIAAMERVVAAMPDARLIIAGTGDDVSTYRDIANRSRAAKNILFTGFVSSSVLRGLYRQVGLFAMPSIQEGFGLVYAEAMAAGLPCVASNCDAAGEVVLDGETGLLVDPSDHDALAGSLLKLLQDDEYRQRLGSQGRKRFEEHFTEEKFHERAWNLINEAIANSPARFCR
jgi:asparagine synthase (glutamine-hydrolysing)